MHVEIVKKVVSKQPRLMLDNTNGLQFLTSTSCLDSRIQAKYIFPDPRALIPILYYNIWYIQINA